jgi:hypothetical protein
VQGYVMDFQEEFFTAVIIPTEGMDTALEVVIAVGSRQL